MLIDDHKNSRLKRPAERSDVPEHPDRIGVTFLYAVYCRGHAKIGIARELSGRMATLRTGTPFPVTLLSAWAIDSAKIGQAELEAQRALDTAHVTGEWFRCSKADARLAVANAAGLRDGKPVTLTEKRKRRGRSARRIETPQGSFESAQKAALVLNISRQAVWSKCVRGVAGWGFVDADGDPVEAWQRTSISLPASMWHDIKEYRKAQRIVVEAEAIRRLIHEALSLHRSGKAA